MDVDGAPLMELATWVDASHWSWYHYVMFSAAFSSGWELLAFLVVHVPTFFSGVGRINIRGKHLDALDTKDITFVVFNRLVSSVFIYHFFQFLYHGGASSGHVEWDLDKLTALNTIVAMPAFFVVYDFFYCFFHMALHHRSIYALIHKHHHRQIAPSRGNSDAINVHPFEFLSGEYLHLLAVYIVPCHVVTAISFLVFGGVLAQLNHTRYDINFPFGIYGVKYHDQHHVVPNTNYSQYTMLWDRIAGSYKDHPGIKKNKD